MLCGGEGTFQVKAREGIGLGVESTLYPAGVGWGYMEFQVLMVPMEMRMGREVPFLDSGRIGKCRLDDWV